MKKILICLSLMIFGCDNDSISRIDNDHSAYAERWARQHNATNVVCIKNIRSFNAGTNFGSMTFDSCTMTKNNKTIRMFFVNRDIQEPTIISEDPE